MTDYCEFDKSFFAKGQDITLLEDEAFSKYVQKGEKGVLIVDLQAHRVVSEFLII